MVRQRQKQKKQVSCHAPDFLTAQQLPLAEAYNLKQGPFNALMMER